MSLKNRLSHRKTCAWQLAPTVQYAWPTQDWNGTLNQHFFFFYHVFHTYLGLLDLGLLSALLVIFVVLLYFSSPFWICNSPNVWPFSSGVVFLGSGFSLHQLHHLQKLGFHLLDRESFIAMKDTLVVVSPLKCVTYLIEGALYHCFGVSERYYLLSFQKYTLSIINPLLFLSASLQLFILQVLLPS